MVCSNCHREIHSGYISNIGINSSFNEDKAKEIDIIVEETKNKKKYYCKYCGIEVYRHNDCCTACASINLRVVDRPSRQELKNLIRTLSFVQIGKIYGVTDNSIRKWCDKYNLPRKKTDINNFTDEQWELI